MYGEPVLKEKEFNWDQPRDDSDVGMSKDFKTVIIVIFNEVKENKLIINGNMGNLSREIEINENFRTEK